MVFKRIHFFTELNKKLNPDDFNKLLKIIHYEHHKQGHVVFHQSISKINTKYPTSSDSCLSMIVVWTKLFRYFHSYHDDPISIIDFDVNL
jgi:hypothetical protein